MRITRQPVATVWVQWFCTCGGQLVVMPFDGRPVRSQIDPNHTVTMYPHKCVQCGVVHTNHIKYPHLAPATDDV